MFARMRARDGALDAREAVNAASFERLFVSLSFSSPPSPGYDSSMSVRPNFR